MLCKLGEDMEFNKKTIDELADKLLIGLTPLENQTLLDEFSLIEENMNLINQIKNIEKVEPMTHPIDLYTAKLRDDEPCPSITFKDALKNTDQLDGREVKVPKTVG